MHVTMFLLAHMHVIMLLLACIHVTVLLLTHLHATMLLLVYMHITILLLADVGSFFFQTDFLSVSVFKQGGFHIIMKKMLYQIYF